MQAAPASKTPLLVRAGEIELEFRDDGRAVAVQPYKLATECSAQLAVERLPLATNRDATVVLKSPAKLQLQKGTELRLSENGLYLAFEIEAEVLAEALHFSASGEQVRFIGTVPVVVEAGTLVSSIEPKAAEEYAREAA